MDCVLTWPFLRTHPISKEGTGVWTDLPSVCYRKSFFSPPLTPSTQMMIWVNCDGHLIFYNSGPIVWKSNRQHTISLSTTETELDNFVNCVRSVLHIMRILWLESMGSPQNVVNIFEDNRSTIATCTNNMSPGNSKWLQDHLQKRDIKIHHVPTSLNMTDIITKPLPRETFVRCIVNALKPDKKPDDILPPIIQNEGGY